DDAPDAPFEQALRDAITAGAVIVFPVGEHSPIDDQMNVCSGAESRAVIYPALLAGSADESLSGGIIAVSATNQWDEFKTHFCDDEVDEPSQDLDAFWGSNRGPEVSLSAPGVEIWSTNFAPSAATTTTPLDTTTP